MKLVLAKTFAERYFDELDRPDLRTVRSWVRSGEIGGREVGRQVYVDLEAWENKSGNKLADKILKRLEKDEAQASPPPHQSTSRRGAKGRALSF